MPKCGGFHFLCMPLPYNKVPISFKDQAILLQKRGMLGDLDFIEEKLKSVNYYRLSAYWFGAWQINSDGTHKDVFKDGSDFNIVWDRYTFDRRLRLSIMDAIERIEVDFKTNFVNVLTLQTNNPFAHLDPANFPNFPISKKSVNPVKPAKVYEYPESIRHIKSDVDKSCEEFVIQHRNKYTGSMPFWKTCEVIPFGTISILFEGLDNHTKRNIAKRYGMSAKILEDAIGHLCYLRNLCAHHSRVWNRDMAIKYTIPAPKNIPIFHAPSTISNRKAFGSLSLLKYFMDIVAPQSRWTNNFFQLISEHPTIPLSSMQMPKNWTEYDLWKSAYLKWKSTK